MRKLYLLILCLSAASANAQLNTPQKLYYLCKVWGYLKHQHPDNCSVQWNNLLLNKVDSVAASTSDASFHSILYNMCLQTGISSRPATPTVISGDTAINYSIAWLKDPALPPSVQEFLDSVHAHRIANTSGCLFRVNNYTDPSFISYIDFRRDSIKNIPGFSYANLNHRMLAYFYYWNAVNYFFPQIGIADHSWDSTLMQLMPDMIAAATDSAFELTLARVSSRIDDSHGVFNGIHYFRFLTGANITTQSLYRPRLYLARVENKHVVIASGEPGVQRGDIITRIDSMDADSFFARWSPYFAAGNSVTKYRNMYRMMLYGPYSAVRRLELVDASGASRQADVYATMSSSQYTSWYYATVDTLPEWSVTTCGYGYVNMGKLSRSNVPLMYSDLASKPAIIFDIRNYPQGALWDLKPLLLGGPNINAWYFAPDLANPGYYHTKNDLNNFGSWTNNAPYSGKIFILVNEETQSHAEYTAQALRTFPRATIIGSQTAGADGNIAYVELPNNIRAYWSGLGWYQADWYNPQRAGVRVDSVVHRSINGVRSGKDELLLKAFDCGLGMPGLPVDERYVIRQQDGWIGVQSSGHGSFEISLFNMLGQRTLHSSGNIRQARINTEGLAPGMYVLTVLDRDRGGVRQQVLIR